MKSDRSVTTGLVEGTSEPAQRGTGDPLLQVDEDVGPFRIRKLLGQGGMGQVYLARDLTLGRLVALKVLQASGTKSVGRLLEEARITARLSHPNIVTVFSVGVHSQHPYLALEYIEGESLSARIARESMPVDEILRIGRSIADALCHAHQAGVIHGDLKPANVMLGRDGRPRVVDFGLAMDAASLSTAAGGTPAHMAPEQWAMEPVTERTDLWALGILIYRCIEGRLPFSRPGDRTESPAPLQRPGLPGGLSDFISRCLARDVAARPTATEARELLSHALETGSAQVMTDGPYRGLLHFEARHLRTFHGREAEIDQVLERLRVEPNLAIVGPSGIGKSSFAQAGIAGRLLARGAWSVVGLRPGANPFQALARALLLASRADPEADVAEESEQLAVLLRSKPELLALRLADLASGKDRHTLLLVDQLEELFVLTESEGERAQFLRALQLAATTSAEPIRCVVTIRDDFIGQWVGLDRVFVLGAPSREALRGAIVEPLRAAGYGFDDPRVVEEIVAELDGSAGQLPLLQFTLRQLWDRRDETNHQLRRQDYLALGGVAGALSRHGDNVLSGLTPEQLAAVREILLRLVSEESTRRILERPKVLDALGPEGEAALNRLTESRLVVQRRALGGADALVELAHESLINRWPTLQRWVDDSREERVLQAELEAAAELWLRRGQRQEETWEGDALRSAIHRTGQLHLVPSDRVRAFLGAGEQRERRRRRRLIILAAAGAALLLAITAGALWLAREFRARELAERNQRQELSVAGADLGHSILWLEPFDRDGESEELRPIDAGDLERPEITLFRPQPQDPFQAGEPLRASEHRWVSRTSTLSSRVGWDLEAPGIQAFARIDGRGRAGERPCAPAWVRIRALPGYSETLAHGPRILRVAVPTCQASRAGTVLVEAGDFVYGGLGDPPVAPSAVHEDEQTLDLPSFRVDKSEVSNRRFQAFASLASITGETLPNYPKTTALRESGEPDHPVTGVDAHTAAAFCAFYGGRLPLFTEWVKVVRGGLKLPDGSVNPEPRRRFPWGRRPTPPSINLRPNRLGCPGTCSTAARGPEADVFGVRDLVGNVQEWGSGWLAPHDEILVPVFGGAFGDNDKLPDVSTVTANQRDARYFDFTTGIRCVADE